LDRDVNEPASSAPRPGGNQPEFTVSELAGAIKRALEEGFGFVRLRGEVSGFRGQHSSGHCYFALKDEKARIEAVIWRTTWTRLKVKPEEGMEVIAQGRVTTFPGSSKYQIVIDALEPAGIGALMAVLEERRRKFAAEGLFDEARKKPLPFLPKVVGIVTSPTGAVIRDMLHGFEERFPTHVLVWPVRVQGETCAAEVAAAIRGFNALAPGGPLPRPDVLIVARGGGSLEDLWGFNDEAVVRAAADSAIPLVSAVGHETDWTLLDHVADARAPTPTKAAEWAVPVFADLADSLAKLDQRLGTGLRRFLQTAAAHLKGATRGLPRLEDLLSLPRQRFDGAADRLERCFLAYLQKRHTRLAQLSGRLPRSDSLVRLPRQRFEASARRLGRALVANAGVHQTRHARVAGRLRPAALHARVSRCRERLDGLERRAARALAGGIAAERRRLAAQSQLLASLSYQSALRRGFAVVRDAAGGMVRSIAQVKAGDSLQIELADGRFGAQAEGARSDPADAPGEDKAPRPRSLGPRTARKSNPSGSSGQGSLF
jgi:exodeoxyribonuclease VII large subunit